jgi:hypothetical protein
LKHFSLAAFVGGLFLFWTVTTQAQTRLAPLSGFVQGLHQGQMQAQQLEAMRLQNELLRLQIEKERADNQARMETYERARTQQQLASSTQPQPSEACAALQAVIEARERYGLVGSFSEKDRDAATLWPSPF